MEEVAFPKIAGRLFLEVGAGNPNPNTEIKIKLKSLLYTGSYNTIQCNDLYRLYIYQLYHVLTRYVQGLRRSTLI